MMSTIYILSSNAYRYLIEVGSIYKNRNQTLKTNEVIKLLRVVGASMLTA